MSIESSLVLWPSSGWFEGLSAGNKLFESPELFRSDLSQSPDGIVGDSEAGRDGGCDRGRDGGCDGGRDGGCEGDCDCGRDVDEDCFDDETGFAGICVGRSS